MTRFDATDRRPVDKWTAAPRPTTSPQGQKPQQKRSTHMVHKPVNSECSRQGASCGPSSSDQISARLQKLSKVFAIFGAIFGPARAIFLLEHHARKSPAIRLISLPLPWVFAIVTHGSAYWIGPQYYTASVLPAM